MLPDRTHVEHVRYSQLLRHAGLHAEAPVAVAFFLNRVGQAGFLWRVPTYELLKGLST